MNERMFKTVVIDNRKPKPKLLAYPLLSGAVSYRPMRDLAIRGFETFAVTEANGTEEQLGLVDMAMVYGGAQ